MTIIRLAFALVLVFSSGTWGKVLSGDEASIERKLHMVLEQLEASEQKWHQLIAEQEMEIHQLSRQMEMQNQSLLVFSRTQMNSNVGSKAAAGRTCAEILQANPSSASGEYTIDPDGPTGAEEGFVVSCDMATGETIVSHDAEDATKIESCAGQGCYSKDVVYGATSRQLKTLSRLSTTCSQSIKFECLGVPFEFNSVPYAWWVDSLGEDNRFWSGTDSSGSGNHFCQCSLEDPFTCIDPDLKCNCDALAPNLQVDEGVITAKDLLPVTQLNFGRSSSPGSSGTHTLGKYVCSGRPQLSGPPGSCEDLWLIGYSQNAIYTFNDADVLRLVFCDFSKAPGASGFETPITCVTGEACPAKKFFE